jgi:hypothetical protein
MANIAAVPRMEIPELIEWCKSMLDHPPENLTWEQFYDLRYRHIPELIDIIKHVDLTNSEKRELNNIKLQLQALMRKNPDFIGDEERFPHHAEKSVGTLRKEKRNLERMIESEGADPLLVSELRYIERIIEERKLKRKGEKLVNEQAKKPKSSPIDENDVEMSQFEHKYDSDNEMEHVNQEVPVETGQPIHIDNPSLDEILDSIDAGSEQPKVPPQPGSHFSIPGTKPPPKQPISEPPVNLPPVNPPVNPLPRDTELFKLNGVVTLTSVAKGAPSKYILHYASSRKHGLTHQEAVKKWHEEK